MTPDIFWAHADELLASRDDFDRRKAQLLARLSQPAVMPSDRYDRSQSDAVCRGISVGARASGRLPGAFDAGFGVVLNVTAEAPDEALEAAKRACALGGRAFRLDLSSDAVSTVPLFHATAASATRTGSPVYIHVPIPEGKRGSRYLERALAPLFILLRRVGWQPGCAGAPLLVHCQQGRDRSVCVALAIHLCAGLLVDVVDGAAAKSAESMSPVDDAAKSMESMSLMANAAKSAESISLLANAAKSMSLMANAAKSIPGENVEKEVIRAMNEIARMRERVRSLGLTKWDVKEALVSFQQRRKQVS